MRIWDLTHRITQSILVYPGTEPPRLIPANTLERDGFRETRLDFYSHTGTHMDAPAHMLGKGSYLEAMPAERFCGKAFVLDCTHIPAGGQISREILSENAARLAAVDFLILSTGWEAKWGREDYFGAFPTLSAAALKFCIECGVRGIGLDTMSLDAMDTQEYPNHHRFFAEDGLIVENLCGLGPIRNKTVQFIALPIKYKDADGAPVRAIAIEE